MPRSTGWRQVRFYADVKRTRARTALGMVELVFHGAVHNVRKTHTSAVIGLVLNLVQMVIMIAFFYLMMTFAGMRGVSIRGDYVLFLMSGIFMFMTHVKTMRAVMTADGPTSAIMKHAPMNTLIAVAAAALGALYLQIFSAAIVLYLYHAIMAPLTIDQPVGMMAMLLLAWGTGLGIGMMFRAATPWQPRFFGTVASIYSRLNMIASGKMFVANAMPTAVLAFFDWNPLFHVIDQGRGYIFLNYAPRYSSLEYPVYVMLVCMTIGLIGEYYTGKRVSLSWTMGK
ncbi:ABC transporter permease [Tabrizicola sp. TH137]|uniref:ABC transporter permease n=1 Tax=Tabrizicola sp. TH137 TaxID=2067452 RepID=UPI0020B3F824|nr:ABC transporter permease [Tabrizicola sp. TH137]